MQETINVLKYEFDQLQNENSILYEKIDSIRYLIPDNRKNLDKISKEISRLKNSYTITSYKDSSDIALIKRLSR